MSVQPQLSSAARAKLDIKNGADLRKHVVQHMRKQSALSREVLKTATELRWNHADALMIGGSAMSVAVDGLLVAQQWVDDHPSVKVLLNNTGILAGAAMWVNNFTPVGFLVGVVVELGYT